MNIEKFLVPEGKKLNLTKHKTDFTGDYTEKKEAKKDLGKNIEKLSELQDMLYARQYARSADNFSGDGRRRKRRRDQTRMSGLNPQGFMFFRLNSLRRRTRPRFSVAFDEAIARTRAHRHF